jgi:uncharacterized protein YfaS (alpha-2-macroglobulin family)
MRPRVAVDAVVAAVVTWTQGLLRKRREKRPAAEEMPIRLTIYGPNGEVLKQVTIRDPAEPGDV